MWEQLKRIIKPNGAIILFGSQPFTSRLIASNLDMFKYCLVWEKSRASNFLHSKFQPLKSHEDICIWSFGGSAQGSKSPMVYIPQFTQGKPYVKGVGHSKIKTLTGGLTRSHDIQHVNKSGDRHPRSVIYFKTAESDGHFHPTQKPIALMEYLVKTYTNENELVLDFTMGSGSTGVACVNTNRNFIGIEQDIKYFDIATKRIKESKKSILNFTK